MTVHQVSRWLLQALSSPELPKVAKFPLLLLYLLIGSDKICFRKCGHTLFVSSCGLSQVCLDLDPDLPAAVSKRVLQSEAIPCYRPSVLLLTLAAFPRTPKILFLAQRGSGVATVWRSPTI